MDGANASKAQSETNNSDKIDTIDTNIRYVGYGQRARQLFKTLRESGNLNQISADLAGLAKETKFGIASSSVMHPINPNMIKNSHQIARESQIVAKEARLAGTTVLNIAKTSKSIYNSSLIKPALRNVKLAGGLTKRLIDLQDMIRGVFKKTEDHNNKESIDQKHSRGQRQLIKACNFLSWSYIAGDVTYETLKAYNYHHSSTGKVPSNSTESENSPSDYRMVFIERSLFHMITTVMIPTFAIKYIIKFSVSYVFNPVNYITLNSFATKLRSKEASKHSIHSLVDKSSLQRLLFFRLGPFLVVSTIFPFIPRYLDKPVEKYLHRAFKAVSK